MYCVCRVCDYYIDEWMYNCILFCFAVMPDPNGKMLVVVLVATYY